MADFAHVDAELVAAAGLREQADAGFVIGVALYAPVGDGLFAVLMVDHLQGPVGPVDNQGQVYGAGLFGDMAPDAGNVCFLDLTFFKLQAQVALGVAGQGEHHDAGCVAVEAMDEERVGEDFLHAGDQAISQVRAFAGDGKQAAWFVHQQDFVIVVEER